MKPQFTPTQLARQKRLKKEEQFGWASTILNTLMLFPFLTILFPIIIPVAVTALGIVELGLKANRYQILHNEQKALNASKKDLLTKKDALLTELSKFDTSAIQITQLGSPTNINFSISGKESKVIDGGVTKKRHIDPALVKPTNILNNLIKTKNDVPSNIR